MTCIRDLMTPAPHTIGADQPVSAAAQRMRHAHVRHLPVLAGAQLVGVISERDTRLVENLAKPDAVKVSDVMSADPFVVQADADVESVVEKLADRKLGSAIVVDEERVVGIFTTTDALHLLVRHLRIEGRIGF